MSTVELGEMNDRNAAILTQNRASRRVARILIAEDESIIALTIQRVLKKLGYEAVGVVSCGEDVSDVARATQPDLILMDIHFSGEMDGIAAAEGIRRELDIPVVFLTAHSDDYTLQRAMIARPYAYVLKPFEERDLLVAVEVALQKHSAEKRMHASEQRKDEVISIVAHELRTPLTSIKGSLTYLALESNVELPQHVARMLDIAKRSVERMERLINDLLDLDRIESGKLYFSLERQKLLPLLEASLESLRSYAHPLGVQFVLECPDPTIEAVVDPDRLQQVLSNLLSNAAKVAPRDSAITLTAERSPGIIRIAVTDSGPGIPDEFRNRIFQRFAQANSSAANRQQGSGLGLSIAKAIVEHMGGKIGFETGSGKGTTFYVEFPA